MKAFVLLADFGYDGKEFVGVFETNELAEQQWLIMLKYPDRCYTKDYDIVETEIRTQTDENLKIW